MAAYTDYDEGISDTGQDCCMKMNDSGYSETRTTDYHIADSADADRWITGMRWASVDIPQGATIDGAVVNVYIENNNYWDNLYTTIWGEDADDANDWASNDNPLDRVSTTATVNWGDGSGEGFGQWIESPDISTIIQEIVNRASWAGDHLVLCIEGRTSGTTYNSRQYSMNQDIGYAPTLEIDYTAGGNPIVCIAA